MLLTGTVHPPGGASAVLAATSPELTEMGWYFVGLVMLGTMLMLIVGLVVNNIQRQFPMYWWTPLSPREMRGHDVEVGAESTGGSEQNSSNLMEDKEQQITISVLGVTLPEALSLNGEEAELLERLRSRLERKIVASGLSVSSGSTADMTMIPSHGARSSEDKTV